MEKYVKKKEYRHSELESVNDQERMRHDLDNEYGFYFGITQHSFDTDLLNRPKNKLNSKYLDQFK